MLAVVFDSVAEAGSDLRPQAPSKLNPAAIAAAREATMA
jgi:hypothetical protein